MPRKPRQKRSERPRPRHRDQHAGPQPRWDQRPRWYAICRTPNVRPPQAATSARCCSWPTPPRRPGTPLPVLLGSQEGRGIIQNSQSKRNSAFACVAAPTQRAHQHRAPRQVSPPPARPTNILPRTISPTSQVSTIRDQSPQPGDRSLGALPRTNDMAAGRGGRRSAHNERYGSATREV